MEPAVSMTATTVAYTMENVAISPCRCGSRAVLFSQPLIRIQLLQPLFHVRVTPIFLTDSVKL